MQNSLSDFLYIPTGHSAYSESVLPFTSFPTHSKCSSVTCVVIDMKEMGFLRGTEYHVTIKAKNTAGLATYIPVEPYTVPFTLDSDCLSVFEHSSNINLIHLPKESYDSYFSQQHDQDILLKGDTVSVGWYGLTDNHLDASFLVAIGTLPGQSDVLSFRNAGNQNPFQLSGVKFELGVTYYSTVKAMNDHSVVTVSSDGFMFIDASIKDAEIWNGLSDNFNEEYRLSSTEISAHWYFPSSISEHVSYYEWALSQANDHDVHDLTTVLEYESVGSLTWGIRPGELDVGTIYVTSVKACFKSSCLEPVYSDGFFVASPPNASTSSIKALYTPYTIDAYGYSSSGGLSISWDPFTDQVGIAYYEWAIGSANDANELLTNWTVSTKDVFSINATLSKTLSLHRQYFVTVRGINIAGLEARISTSLSFTGDHTFDDIIVFDVYSESVPDQSKEIEFIYTEYNELDYTSSNDSLSAVWPDLRYTTYNYSISTVPAFHPCNTDSPSLSIACGSTAFNGITVSGLNLTHGRIYYFCIHAEAGNAFTPYPSQPETITTCSNGIMAYLTPPTPSCVQVRPFYQPEELPKLTIDEVGSGFEDMYHSKDDLQCVNEPGSQSSTSELHIIWSPFSDEVESTASTHDLRVAYYEYAIGTAPGTENVVEFTEVGVVTSVYVTGLALMHGLTYYATIKGIMVYINVA